MDLVQTALNYSMHLNKLNKFDVAIATLTSVMINAQEVIDNNGVHEIIEKQYVDK